MLSSRCGECRKKEYLAFECKCQKKFCSKHRLPEYHNCPLFDQIIEEGRRQLAKNNPQIKAEKIIKI